MFKLNFFFEIFWVKPVFFNFFAVMAETLLWRKYIEQYQIIYPSYRSFGAGFIVIVLLGFGCSIFKVL